MENTKERKKPEPRVVIKNRNKDKYRLLNQKGKLLFKFRTKVSAENTKKEIEKKTGEELTLEKI